MLVRVLRECQCTLSFWYDRHWGDRWKDDVWVERERQETLKSGQEINAVRVRPSAMNEDCCDIDVSFMGDDMTNCYRGVPWECIEVIE
jgi:hypothetical protein